MATVKAYADRGAMITHEYPNSTLDAPADLGTSTYTNPFSMTKFAIPTTLKGKEITRVDVYAYGYVEWDYRYERWDYDVQAECGEITENWDESNVTYNTRPAYGKVWYMSPASETHVTGYQWCIDYYSTSSSMRAVITHGAVFKNEVYTYNAASNKPYLEIEYIDPTIYLSNVSPQSGYVPKNLPTTFSWEVAGENYVYGGVEQTSGTLQWRVGTSDTIKSISVGSAQQYTMPAGTFAGDSIQWRVTVVAAGQTKTSPWYTLSTVEPLSAAEAISPIGGIIDSTRDTVFAWRHVIETGTPQTGYDLLVSADGTVFETIQSEQTENQYAIVPANTLDAGQLFWRVATYNTDGKVGSASATVQTTVVGASEPPVVVLTDSSPRPAIRWQSTGQQGYEIQIDGETVVNTYGTSKDYRAETYLADGQHTIRVRVQNQYSLWSDWGSVSVLVSNVAGSAIVLTAYDGEIAQLSWITSGAYDKYYVYRDGELLAKVTEKQYDDALTSGRHRYQVRGAYDGSGDYGLSNEVSVMVLPETTIIATVDGAASVRLPYSETNKRGTSVNTQRKMAMMYFSGSALPSVELAEWTDRSMTITAALKPGESKAQLMALVGQIVCARDQYGNCAIGVLPGWTVRDFEMYSTVQTTIQDVNWREAVRHDPIT